MINLKQIWSKFSKEKTSTGYILKTKKQIFENARQKNIELGFNTLLSISYPDPWGFKHLVAWVRVLIFDSSNENHSLSWMEGYNRGPNVNWPRQKEGGSLPAGVGVFKASPKVPYL